MMFSILASQSVTSTILKRASFRIMRAYASAAFASGTVSIIGRIPCRELKESVSSASIEDPVIVPAIERIPKRSGTVFISSNSRDNELAAWSRLSLRPFLTLTLLHSLVSAPGYERGLTTAGAEARSFSV